MSIRAWLKRLKQWRFDDEDFEEEVRAHLKIAEDERMADGADRETAHYAALKDFGNVTLTTEAARQVWKYTPAGSRVKPFAGGLAMASTSFGVRQGTSERDLATWAGTAK